MNGGGMDGEGVWREVEEARINFRAPLLQTREGERESESVRSVSDGQ